MARFFLAPQDWDRAALTGEEAVHCCRVLRAKPGDRIEVFDGLGRSAPAVVASVSRQRVALEMGASRQDPEPAVKTVLAQAVIKGKGMEWLIQKAVELGVGGIQPLTTRHAVVKPGDDKPDKWRRTALEACKQCGRSRVPEFGEVRSLEDFLSEYQGGLKLIAALSADTLPLAEAIRSGPPPREAAVLVGPEGDFAPHELEAARRHGWQPVGLGNTVLRSETAALYAISAFRYTYG
ncbi:RsmE family RNA methyltransferase [Haloferula sargassicola]|uniref:Ribosomal RNA small subunit methyltransferase E n=1 Tax=Haloferula sargassicola TaxID=490096 RepID=A0ABP9UJZ4_9BACT